MQPTALSQRDALPAFPPAPPGAEPPRLRSVRSPSRPRLMSLATLDPARLADELDAGLSSRPACVSPKFLYDELGSRLFDAITALPEYYPTRVEGRILAAHRDEICRALGAGRSLIDLGAGDCRKAEALFGCLAPRQYVALDISLGYLAGALRRLARDWPAIDVIGLGVDLAADFRLPADIAPERRLFFYPGSSIGNFTPEAAVTLLARLRDQAGDDGRLLLGADLVKPAPRLEAAYDDPLGVTAAFNRNLLLHANRLLGADFDASDWRHLARWNPQQSRIDMYLEARRDQEVSWRGRSHFYPLGTRIHTESSHKYRPDDLDRLLAAAGWHLADAWFDEARQFAVVHARAA
ncbi:L-histidine N(alpha)-methyltransferase [Derxia gummosa]|uniref:L-histidine N(Alpha)-methyltransferase n=1 Tax=Derxia gummosa DSM 723 TaxID=1121388 RepID=A0A9U5H1G7_9BURK|nr:L-histidine N(alpha)-methyltransferase [Derxia gummosa]